MLKKVLTVTTAVAMFFAANSQDSTKGTTTMTYSIDAYTRYDFAGNSKVTNNYTSFTNSTNSFELGMASVRVDHSIGKVSATADLGFGRRAEEFSYNDGAGYPTGSGNSFNTLAAVKQAFVAYQATSKIKFTMGKWATHIGWELLDAYNNSNYSMSYGFSEGPFFHTGLRADITLSGTTALMVGIANPTDHSTAVTGNKMAIAQFSTGTKSGKLKAYLNYQGGTDAADNKIQQLDLVLNFVLSSKWGLNYDGTVQGIKPMGGSFNNWSSNAAYLCFNPTSKFGLTLREEYFSDKDGLKISTAGVAADNIIASTLSANFHINNLTIIPEIRLDAAKNKVFAQGDGTGTSSASNFLLAATYKF